MSLLIWLPLNGDLRNQGVSNSTISLQNGTPTYKDAGKSGSCFYNSSSGSNITVPCNSLSDELSITFWIKPDSPAVWMDLFSIGQYANRMECNGDNYYLFTDDTSHALAAQATGVFSLPNGLWSHIAYTVDGTNVKIYFNGELKKTVAQLSSLSDVLGQNKTIYVGRRRSSENSYYEGYYNDFRVYDTCLSPKEVSEIAKSMICHYPLNDIACTASVNKYSGDTANGKCSGGSFTVTKLNDEIGYNYKSSYTGNGNNSWATFEFPTISFTVGKTYDYSCKIKCRENTAGVYMRAARCSNDWSTNMVGIIADEKWHEYHLKQFMAGETFLRSGTTDIQKTAPRLEFYTSPRTIQGKAYTFDADIKDVQISECGSDVPFMTGSFANNTVYDTSGLSNHGSVSSNRPSYSNDSPRYEGSTVFNGSSTFITTPKSVKVTDEITVSIWGYCTAWSNANSRLFSCTEGGGWNIENMNDGRINFPLYAGGAYRSCTSSTTWSSLSSGWHHFAVTYDGLKSCIYIDGKLDSTSTWFTSKTPITYNVNNTVFIGAEASGNNTTPVGTYFNGKLSDFRLYATALSADAIKQLYNSPISVTNTGVLMTQGEFKEQ